MKQLNVVPNPPPRPELVAGARPTAIVPTSLDEAYRLAKAIVLSGTAPKSMTTPEACMIAIQEVSSWLDRHEAPERVTFCCFSEDDADRYRRGIDENH